uniref:Ground-like domain-containing protein n=1 Tax=Panagrellus redivivus TaxID=6233 RepID=A0A7E4VCD3_PANRE
MQPSAAFALAMSIAALHVVCSQVQNFDDSEVQFLDDDVQMMDPVMDYRSQNLTNTVPLDSWPPSRRRIRFSKKKPKLEAKCNSDELRRIIKENIDHSPSTAKRLIYHAALETMKVHLNVICSRCSFSFLIRTTLFCQDHARDITCFAYRDE